jgi:hypothetical protein
MQDRYKFDFLQYHRQDLDWFAFVTILFLVNVLLIIFDDILVFTGGKLHDGMTED